MAELNQTLDTSKLEGVTSVIPSTNNESLPLKDKEINFPKIDISKFEGVTSAEPSTESSLNTSKLEGVTKLETDSSTQLSTSDTFTNYEKIRYGIDKQNQFFGNLYRITKAGVQALFDPDNEFKDYVEQNYEQEQKN